MTPEITEAIDKLQAEIIEYADIAHYLSHINPENLIPEDRLRFNETKLLAQDMTGLNRSSDVAHIVAKLRKLVENKKRLLK